jgi:hemoglobin-like flavoprotein
MDSKVVQNHPRYDTASKILLKSFDRALDMIGPADEVVSDILKEVGISHGKMGVKPQYFSALGVALLDMLENNLSRADFDDDVKAAWVEVYTALSNDMIQAMKHQ